MRSAEPVDHHQWRAGATPVGNGGPFVGPYGGAANAISGSLQGQNNPACVSPSPCPWQTTNMTGWAELQTVPLRLYFNPGQNGASPTHAPEGQGELVARSATGAN